MVKILKEVRSIALSDDGPVEVSNISNMLNAIRIKIKDKEVIVDGNEMIEACKEALRN